MVVSANPVNGRGSYPCESELCGSLGTIAVIIYDMQVGIISQIAEGPAVLKKCLELVAAARESGYRIFFTRHMANIG